MYPESVATTSRCSKILRRLKDVVAASPNISAIVHTSTSLFIIPGNSSSSSDFLVKFVPAYLQELVHADHLPLHPVPHCSQTHVLNSVVGRILLQQLDDGVEELFLPFPKESLSGKTVLHEAIDDGQTLDLCFHTLLRLQQVQTSKDSAERRTPGGGPLRSEPASCGGCLLCRSWPVSGGEAWRRIDRALFLP